MRSIKNIELFNSNRSIKRSFNNNQFNLILTPRRWGLTTLLIDYVNEIQSDKSILFNVANSIMVRDVERGVERRITNRRCMVKTISETSSIGYRYDYIICDNFFNQDWLKNMILLAPILNTDGKIILADSGKYLGENVMGHFRNYNKIIKTSL